MNKCLLIFYLFFPCVLLANEYTVESIPNPHALDTTNFVGNPDGILNSQTVSQINHILQSLHSDTKAEVAVVLVNSIGHNDIKNFAVKLFEKWGIGKKGLDNGLLILFVLDQRKITFETGYGLEGILPDAICKRIQMQAMLPEFKNGNYNAGMLAGIEQVVSIIRKEPVPEQKKESMAWNEILPIALAGYLLLIIVGILWINNLANKIRKDPQFKTNIDRYLALKNQKAGVISTMAVFLPLVLMLIVIFFFKAIYVLLLIPVPFTVIPANVYAKINMRKMRRTPIICDMCRSKMHLLSGKEENKYLQPSQQVEKQLKSVDYDVFLCNSCKNAVVFPLDMSSAYSHCPHCRTKAFTKQKTQTIVAPTYLSAGTKRTNYRCKYCGYEEQKDTKLPRLRRSAGPLIAGGAGTFSGGRGGFGSGGFGGGSFGGGRSGGGGATSGW